MYYICNIKIVEFTNKDLNNTSTTMKETVNVNIGSEAFTLDRDAYHLLRSYLNDIRSHLPAEDSETMVDVEMRIAEIFREKVASPMRVITLDTVRAAIGQMGSPDEFGECSNPGQPDAETEAESPRKLYRSRAHRSIAGICGGLADFFGIDATLLRLVTLLLMVFGGLSIWIYIILWIIIPEEPAHKFDINHKKQ